MQPEIHTNGTLEDERERHRSGAFLNQFWDGRTARVLFTILVFAAVLSFVYAARETFTLFLFAIFFAYFLAPLVAKLEPRVRSRGRAILIVYVALIVLVVGAGYAFGPRIASEGKALAESLPSLISRISSGELLNEFGQRHQWSDERGAAGSRFRGLASCRHVAVRKDRGCQIGEAGAACLVVGPDPDPKFVFAAKGPEDRRVVGDVGAFRRGTGLHSGIAGRCERDAGQLYQGADHLSGADHGCLYGGS